MLALLNYLPNLDCVGLKVDNLREYMTERDVWSPILKWKNPAMRLDILTFIARFF